MEHEKKIIFSATQPSGRITLGNYLLSYRHQVGLVEQNIRIEIYSAVTGMTPEAVENEFNGKGYGVFKPAVGSGPGISPPG